jgi:hypothetical protein
MTEGVTVGILSLTHHEWLGEVVMSGLVLLGLMHFCAWWFDQFVTWSHRMRTLWRRFRTEPTADVAHS